MTTSTECRLLLRDVHHLPEVRLNMMSACRLDDEGYEGSIWNGTMNFYKVSLILARARKINRLYLMHGRICQEKVNVAADNTGELLHKRLCHMSQKGIRRLAEDNLILEVKNVQLEKCTDCLAGKQNRTSFRSRPPHHQGESLEYACTCQIVQDVLG